MLRFVLIIFLSCVVFFASAQGRHNDIVKNLPKYDYKRIHFGFTVGLNSMDFTIKHSDIFFSSQIKEVYGIEDQGNTGFHLGPISNLRLGDHFDLRLLLHFSFGQRNLNYTLLKDTVDNLPVFKKHTMKIETVYMEMPLLIKYKSVRINNYRPYMIAGICPKTDLAAEKEIKEEEKPKIRIGKYDLCYEVGAGVDFYFEYFKLSCELKFSGGTKNLLINDGTEYTRSLSDIKSRMFLFSIHFE